ncbi:MAG TPA: glycosyltransferase [Acidimicrobiales bacterium]|nr:glycosyltransferase [Acidimicrobiales bacterium]
MAGPARRPDVTSLDRPVLRVGIVSWNTAPLLDRCLAALPAALDGVPAEVVVVDNDSADDSAAVAARHGVEVAVNPENRGYAVAMNQALAGSAAPLLLALNPDTEPPPGSLRRLVDAAGAHPGAGVVVPRLVGPDGRHQPSAYRVPGALVPLVAALSTRRLRQSRLGQRLLLESGVPHRGGPVGWAIGAVHLVRAAALGGEAPYDERSFMYAEDLDLCWRLADRGWPTVLVADVTIPHVGNAAGAQAWGDERSLRYWTATYDVIARRRSRGRARVVAAGCAVAAAASLARMRAGAALGRPHPDRAQAAAVRRRELALHATMARRGALPPLPAGPAAPAPRDQGTRPVPTST